MRKVMDFGMASADELRGLLRRINKKEKLRNICLIILAIIIIAAILAVVITKFCAKNCCCGCSDGDEQEDDDCGCDENGCNYTTDEDFEK